MTRAADLLVLLRALAVVPIAWAILADQRTTAFALFALAALSDAADGWLARRGGPVTRRGALIDPLADKILVVGTAAALTAAATVPLLLLGLIALREIGAALLRASSYRGRTHQAAGRAGKAKTALEMVALAALIVTRPPDLAGTAALAVLWVAAVIGLVTLPRHLRPADPP